MVIVTDGVPFGVPNAAQLAIDAAEAARECPIEIFAVCFGGGSACDGEPLLSMVSPVPEDHLLTPSEDLELKELITDLAYQLCPGRWAHTSFQTFATHTNSFGREKAQQCRINSLYTDLQGSNKLCSAICLFIHSYINLDGTLYCTYLWTQLLKELITT